MRVLIVDDDPLVRRGLAAIVASEDGWEVVGEAGDGEAALAVVAESRPDLVIMDVRMPGVDGLTATAQITEGEPPAPKVLVLTTFETEEYVYEALRAGASGFVLKRVSPQELIEAIRVVVSGESLVLPSMTRDLIERFTPRRKSPDLLAHLSDREREVLRMLALGHSNQEISDDLYISAETVKSHVGAILLKLGVRDRTQAVIAGYESGFVQTGGSAPE